MRILCIDVGTGTQDILLFDSSVEIENCVHMVMPSPTQIVTRKVAVVTAARHTLLLGGVTMGGGPCAAAVDAHINDTLAVYATPAAGRTVVAARQLAAQVGVHVGSDPAFGALWDSIAPEWALFITFQDIDLPSIK